MTDRPTREVCRNNMRGACRFGRQCFYIHDDDARVQANSRQNLTSDATMAATLTGWAELLNKSRPLHGGLSEFFGKASLLVASNEATTQQVIIGLASEEGVTKLRECLDKEYTVMTPLNLSHALATQILPLFRAISHPQVLLSVFLQPHVAKIYSVLFESGGAKAKKLFAAAFEGMKGTLQRVGNAGSISAYLSPMLEVLSKLIQLHDLAKHQTWIQKSIADLGAAAAALEDGTVKVQAGVSLQKAMAQLGDRQLAPVDIHSGPPTSVPGQLENGRPRHDNDFDDIRRIQIMPTSDEVASPHHDYLPREDPASWHLQGVSGLLDRQFRLLREDAVGPFRDGARRELQRLHVRGRQSRRSDRDEETVGHSARTRVYQNVKIHGIGFSFQNGFEFTIAFDQPSPVLGCQSLLERFKWWDEPKRLDADALICLLDDSGAVTYCTVEPIKRRSRTSPINGAPAPPLRIYDNETKGVIKTIPTLYDDAERACVVIKLVTNDAQSVQRILEAFSIKETRQSFSVVEFPGVLVQSFLPTLEALKQKVNDLNLPFSDLLAPTPPSGNAISGEVRLECPLYAKAPDFSFSLDAICKNGKRLTLHPGALVQGDIDTLQANSDLDESQSAALLHSLCRNLALIQGPPGTGKSFTGVAIAKALLANKAKADLGPTLCVCYTNHALDQVLESLLDQNITEIVRIGSRSESEKLKNRNLRVLNGKDNTKQENDAKNNLTSATIKQAGGIRMLFERLKKPGSPGYIYNYLQQNHPQHFQQLFGAPEGQGFQVEHQRSPTDALGLWLHGGWIRQTEVERTIDEMMQLPLARLSSTERPRLLKYWQSQVVESTIQAVLAAIKEHEGSRNKYRHMDNDSKLKTLRHQDVIGLTTSGLARNLDLLKNLGPKILLCEEAGEVLEAHLLTALLPTIQQAILIGDHMQLRPQVQNYDLSQVNPRSTGLALDKSLFERLVIPLPGAPRVPFARLDTQRRMHPSISRLIRDTVYPQLLDSSVDYPPVVGTKHRLFWLDHTYAEERHDPRDPTQTSRSNDYEVEMVTSLVSYLVKQGTYEKSDIVILTPYLGQLRKLKKRLEETFDVVLNERDREDLESFNDMDPDDFSTTNEGEANVDPTSLAQAVRLATVDNFQGEEAKIVVVSLVRSNMEQNCGFLGTSNRINVLLSRAKHGMYIIGNAKTTERVEMWNNVRRILEGDGLVGDALELQCANHPLTTVAVSKSEDFLTSAPDGGCTLQCPRSLACGHSCPAHCHSSLLHDAIVCQLPCDRKLKACDHPCPTICGEACPTLCKILIPNTQATLPCGHTKASLSCHEVNDEDSIRCMEKVERVVPSCGHTVAVNCFVDVSAPDFVCPAPCGALLACGHRCQKTPCKGCHRMEGTAMEVVVHKKGDCEQPCGKKLTTCDHPCQTLCHPDKPCPPCMAPCETSCSHTKCEKKCSEPCAPCTSKTCTTGCAHGLCTMPCAAPCNYAPCTERCTKALACGHRCPSVCGEKCPSLYHCQACSNAVKMLPVDHDGSKVYKDVALDQDPCIFLSCGHIRPISSLDAHVGLDEYYHKEDNGHYLTLKSLVGAEGSIEAIATCPECHTPLKDIARYSCLFRVQALMANVLKLTIWTNKGLKHHFYAFLIAQIQLFGTHKKVMIRSGTLRVGGDCAHILKPLKIPAMAGRYDGMCSVHNYLVNFLEALEHKEAQFFKVKSMATAAKPRTDPSAQATNACFPRVAPSLMAQCLLVRCKLAMLSDMLIIRHALDDDSDNSSNDRANKSSKNDDTKTIVDFALARADCETLAAKAALAGNLVQQVEALIFWARFVALEVNHTTLSGTTHEDMMAQDDFRDDLTNDAVDHLEEAHALVNAHSNQLKHMDAELMDAEEMIACNRPYPEYAPTILRDFMAALPTEVKSFDDWRVCEKGHVFHLGPKHDAVGKRECMVCGEPVVGARATVVAGDSGDEHAVGGVQHEEPNEGAPLLADAASVVEAAAGEEHVRDEPKEGAEVASGNEHDEAVKTAGGDAAVEVDDGDTAELEGQLGGVQI